MPDRVQLELHPFYYYPDPADRLYARLAVVTAIDLRGDVLSVRAGVSDSGEHDGLASKVDPDSDQRLALPPEMYAKEGLAVAWYYPNMRDVLEGRAEVGKKDINPEAKLTWEETTQCLKMATLAIGLFVVQSPYEVLKQEDLSKIVVDETMLTEADKQFGQYITS